MPTTLAAPNNQGPSDGGARNPDDASVPDGEAAGTVPFTRAALPVVRGTDFDVTTTLTTTQRSLNALKLPTVGYARYVDLLVQGSGGDHSAAGAVFAENGPFNVIREIIFRDVNGAPIVGPITGYELAMYQKYGGHQWQSDPRKHPSFTTDGEGNFTFVLRIPLEIVEREAYGALANQNAASPYRVEISLAPSTDLYDTVPDTTLPDVRIRAYLGAWSQPPSRDPLTGASVERTPRHLDTTQVLTRETIDVSSGHQQKQLSHVGNWIRGLTFILEDSGGAREYDDFPEELTIWLDDRQLAVLHKDLWRGKLVGEYGYDAADEAAGGLDRGVFHYSFANDVDGHPGSELRNAYLLTTPATSLRISGEFGASVDRITVLYNQILPPEAAPTGRQGAAA